MSDPRALRFLAAHYASTGMHRPLSEHRHRDAIYMLDALAELALVDAHDAEAWRGRLDRLRVDAVERPLLPRTFRDAATAYLGEETRNRRGFARYVLQTVGALSWQDDPEARTLDGLIVDRVIPVAPQPASEVTISSVTLYQDAVELRWYAATSASLEPDEPAPAELPSPFGLELGDDHGTRYDVSGAGSSGAPGQVSAGRTRFRPAPPADALWVEVVRREVILVRVALPSA